MNESEEFYVGATRMETNEMKHLWVLASSNVGLLFVCFGANLVVAEFLVRWSHQHRCGFETDRPAGTRLPPSPPIYLYPSLHLNIFDRF